MASQLNPYLTFPHNARQALDFYRSVLGGTVTVHTFGEYGAPDGPGSDEVMHGTLETAGGHTFMAADTPPGTELDPGTNIAMSLSGDDADELRRYWQGLSEGGTVSVPLEKQMWGDEFGMCVDRFGIVWMVNITGQDA